jgi:hypothetical protein
MSKAPGSVQHSQGSESSAGPESVRRRGVLGSLLARSALLAFIYAALNVIYQQSYLSYLGFCVGLWPVATALPLLTDVLIAAYAFMIWVILTRVPDRWFDTAAEIFNLATWRDGKTILYRLVSLATAYCVFIGLNLANILRSGVTSTSICRRLFPTLEMFGQTATFWVSLVLTIVFLAGVWYYWRVRKMGIHQATPARRRRTAVLLNGAFPGGLVLGLAFVFLVVPSWYGRSRAQTDLERLVTENRQKAEHVLFDDHSGDLCEEAATLAEQAAPEVKTLETSKHFIGRMQDLYLFIVLVRPEKGSGSVDEVVGFYPCLVSTSSLHGIEFDRVGLNR